MMESASKRINSDETEQFTNLTGFEFREVLAHHKESKSIVLLCSYKQRDAIVALHKKDWAEDSVASAVLQDTSLRLTSDEQNAEYYQFSATLSAPTKINVTWPARPDQIDKARQGEVLVVRETPEMFAAVTAKTIAALPAKQLDWVRNIFAGTKEKERVLFMDPHPTTGFVILPDFKMDVSDPTSLYLLCILQDEKLKTVRDLRIEHAEILQRVSDTLCRIASEKFGCKHSQLRMYVHYYPTFYWLHIHCTHVKFFVPGGGLNAGKAILLEDVIQNLRIKTTYYQEATLVTGVKVGTPLHQAFLDAGFSL